MFHADIDEFVDVSAKLRCCGALTWGAINVTFYTVIQLGPGIFIYGSRRQAKLILTAEFMEYLRLPTPGTFRTLERTGKYVDQPMQNIVDNLLAEEQRCIAIVNEITSKFRGYPEADPDQTDLVSLANSLQIIVDIARWQRRC